MKCSKVSLTFMWLFTANYRWTTLLTLDQVEDWKDLKWVILWVHLSGSVYSKWINLSYEQNTWLTFLQCSQLFSWLAGQGPIRGTLNPDFPEKTWKSIYPVSPSLHLTVLLRPHFCLASVLLHKTPFFTSLRLNHQTLEEGGVTIPSSDWLEKERNQPVRYA